jgi:hypothetical protein
MDLLRFPIAAPLRSCGAGEQRALLSRASRNAGAAERENGIAVDRLAPVGRRSSPQQDSQMVFGRQAEPIEET